MTIADVNAAAAISGSNKITILVAGDIDEINFAEFSPVTLEN